MNLLTDYSLRNVDRFERMNKAAGAKDIIDVMEKALAMSEADREEYIKNFVEEHGVKETFLMVKKAINDVVNAKEPVTAAGPMYEGFKKKKDPAIDEQSLEMAKRDVVTEKEKYDTATPKEEKNTLRSRIKTVLETLGDWSVLATFFLMWAAISTSDYYSLVVKKPNVHAELKTFLIASGAAFLAWFFKYISSKIKK